MVGKGGGAWGWGSFVFRLQISGLYLISFFWQRLIISSQDQNNAVVSQYIYLKISEDSCYPAMQEDWGPANITGVTDIAEGPELAQAEPSLLQLHTGM